MSLTIRKASDSDLDFLDKLEKLAFSTSQQTARRNIKKGISSDFQEVLIAEQKHKKKSIGAIVLFKYSHTLRIYSIAVLPEFQEKGYGAFLMDYVLEYAVKKQMHSITLEADIDNSKLISWYENKGFVIREKKPDYYGEGKDAVKMVYQIDDEKSDKGIKNIIVINRPVKWPFPDVNAKVITVKDYINQPEYQNNPDLRVFNLCSSYKYQSYGYYVSLLASARGQRVMPSTTTIRDFRILNVIQSATYDIEEHISKALSKVEGTTYSLNVYFGQTQNKDFKKLSLKLYQLFESPLFKVVFVKHEKWLIKDIQVLTLAKLPQDDLENVYEFARRHFNKKRYTIPKLKNYKYDLAILTNPNEATPPSCPEALRKFKEVANKKGLFVEFITKKDADKINEFDALFIRETTNVNDHTYEISRMAYAEGLVVIDDPWSILKCSNKIYQNETFRRHRILTPETQILTKNLFDESMLDKLTFPLVLKQPDSAFSLGVTKVEDKKEAMTALQSLFKKSDMVVCQQFLYSEFDWRIGVLDNKPIYACKYYMTKGHWQIYNWQNDENDQAGDAETLDIADVPEKVIHTALRASALIGDGLYGVDLKMVGDKVYVVEVNDNPNIDAGIEDLVLKDRLYEMVIDSLINRIEVAKNIQKIEFGGK
nr:GNAT family N-acetyltransferase [uncultured Carboxylicivirga sp.]